MPQRRLALIVFLLSVLRAFALAEPGNRLVEVSFHVRPTPFTVYLVTLEKPAEYVETKDGKGYLDVSPSFVEKGRPIKVRFSVPVWGGEYPDWKGLRNEDERRAFDQKGFSLSAPYDSLKGTHAVLPPGGEFHHLELPPWIWFQAWTYAHRLLSLILLLAAVALAAFARRALWARKIKPTLAPVSPADVTTIGGYRIDKLLGEGGMATVYRGTSPDKEEDVAIKLIKSDGGDAASRERFQREIQVLMKLRHPNLMYLYDWGETEDGNPYLICEFLQGETLRQRMQGGPMLAQSEVLALLADVSGALDYIHSRGLVHRDVKPDNIFLCSDGRVKLLDFGIARGADVAAVTQTGQVMGTPRYMSPEQVKGEIHPATDQYALGLVGLELLSGTKLFEDLTPLEIMAAHAHGRLPSLVSLLPSAGMIADAAMRKMTAVNPENRFASAGDAVAALRSGLGADGFGDDTAESQAL